VDEALRAEMTRWLRVVVAEAERADETDCQVIRFPAFGGDAA
jgi:hypothetical protein